MEVSEGVGDGGLKIEGDEWKGEDMMEWRRDKWSESRMKGESKGKD